VLNLDEEAIMGRVRRAVAQALAKGVRTSGDDDAMSIAHRLDAIRYNLEHGNEHVASALKAAGDLHAEAKKKQDTGDTTPAPSTSGAAKSLRADGGDLAKAAGLNVAGITARVRAMVKQAMDMTTDRPIAVAKRAPAEDALGLRAHAEQLTKAAATLGDPALKAAAVQKAIEAQLVEAVRKAHETPQHASVEAFLGGPVTPRERPDRTAQLAAELDALRAGGAPWFAIENAQKALAQETIRVSLTRPREWGRIVEPGTVPETAGVPAGESVTPPRAGAQLLGTNPE
jgi:hypothetical protein